jgi:hypothetical protein
MVSEWLDLVTARGACGGGWAGTGRPSLSWRHCSQVVSAKSCPHAPHAFTGPRRSNHEGRDMALAMFKLLTSNALLAGCYNLGFH